jgi:actin-like ATPase involved in cell morphogenesis
VAYFLGIDIGTTYTAAAVWRDGQVSVATLGQRAPVIPTVVFAREEDGTLLVGEAAERRGPTDPRRLAREFKRRIGDPTPIILGGTPYSADALMSKVLRWVVEKVTDAEGEAPAGIAVSYPANWGAYKKDLLAQEIRLADLTGVATLAEPEAAAIYYASQERVATGSVTAVYDLGGGTFDAAVLRKTVTGWELLGEPEGIERLGGIDFDEAVFQHVIGTLGDDYEALDPEDAATLAALTRLRRECVDAKEALSSDTDVSIPVILPEIQREVRLTRVEFEAMIRPVVAESLGAMQRALRSAGIEAADVSTVLLVGGSSRVPLVGQLVSAELGRPVAIDVHPKYGIALGAAVLAAQQASDDDAALTTEIQALPADPPPAGGIMTPPGGVPAAEAAAVLGAAALGGAALGAGGAADGTLAAGQGAGVGDVAGVAQTGSASAPVAPGVENLAAPSEPGGGSAGDVAGEGLDATAESSAARPTADNDLPAGFQAEPDATQMLGQSGVGGGGPSTPPAGSPATSDPDRTVVIPAPIIPPDPPPPVAGGEAGYDAGSGYGGSSGGRQAVRAGAAAGKGKQLLLLAVIAAVIGGLVVALVTLNGDKDDPDTDLTTDQTDDTSVDDSVTTTSSTTTSSTTEPTTTTASTTTTLPPAVEVPNVVGESEGDATSILQGEGFDVAPTTASSADVPAGTVISTDPAAGTPADSGSTVTIVVSSGPETVTVPDVSGQDQATAQSNLEAAGLGANVGSFPVSEEGQVGVVQDQDPDGGDEVAEGTTINIFVGELSADPPDGLTSPG